MKSYGFGVDIGGTTIKMGFFETSGKLIDKWEIRTNTQHRGRAILPDVAESIRERMARENIAKDEVLGIGVGVPGPVTRDGVVHNCVNLGWGLVNVEQELAELTGLKVKAGNDANVAALGEMWQGGGKGCTDMVMVTLGTGVGGGIIIGGHMAAGHDGAGGEIGHMTVNPEETETCNCGRRGCLEQYVSATGIARLARRKLAESKMPSSLRNYEDLSAKAVFDEARAGDPAARELAEETGRILGAALANIACVVDPEVIVIGGGVSGAKDVLIDPVRKYFEQNAFPSCRKTRFELAALGNDAGIYGCIHMLL